MFKINFNKNKLIKQLQAIYGSTIFNRGKSYCNNGSIGKVKILNHHSKEKIKIEANVYGSNTYSASIVFDFLKNKFISPSCNCPYDYGDCKHSAALGLKFVNLWEEVYKNNKEFLNFEEIKKALINIIKNSLDDEENDFEYGNGENFGDGDDNIIYRDQDDNVDEYYEDGIFGITDKNDLIDYLERQERKKEKLSKLLQMIGIDADSLSDVVLKELGDKLLPKSKKGEIGGVKKSIAPKIVERKVIPDLTKKYHLILRVEYTPRLAIVKSGKSTFYYWENDSKNILKKEKENLSPFQKELLEMLAEREVYYAEEKNDWGKLFELAEKSGFDIFLNTKSDKNKLVFNKNPQRIAVEIFRKETRYEFNYGEVVMQDDFSFRLVGDFYDRKSVYSFCGADKFIVVKNGEISVYFITKILADIIGRILEMNYNYYSGYYYLNNRRPEDFIWETDLADSEIIRINEIVKDAHRCFDLKTNFSENFRVEKFKKIGPIIVVDYNNQSHNLRVRAAVDYGFSKIDVSNTIYKSMRGGRASFQKREFKNREKYHIKIQNNKIHYADIDHKQEKAVFSKFHNDEKYGFTKVLKCVRDNPRKIMHYHENHWPHIMNLKYPIEFLQDELNFIEENFKADFNVDMNAQNDWLAFDVNCYLGSDRITLKDLKNYLRNKEEFIRMNDGRMLKISNWEDLERFILMLESFYQKENGSFEGRAYHAPELQNVFVNSKYYSAKVADGFKKFISEAQSGRPVEKVKMPEKINKTLRDYQKDGISWFHFLRKYRFAGVLADDMGLGKTLQALTLLEMNRVKGEPSMVICPKTLLFNWEQEAVKFFPNLKVLIVEGSPKERIKNISKIKNYDLVVTSYSTIKKDGAAYEKKKIKFNYCFLDEAQFIKNHKTQNAQVVKKIDADYKLALTGTPLENSVSEIWSIFDFLMPGFLGNYNHFTKRFLTPIMKKSDVEALNALRKKTECFMLRRTKSEVLKELPPKIEQIVSVELTEAQNILYQEILVNVKSEIDKTVKEKGFAKSQIHILAGLMKLRQVCNHPVLLLKSKKYTKYESAKLESFKELVEEIVSSGRKVLVFSQFTQMLDILAKVLKKSHIEYLYLSGKTKNRKELVEEFNGSNKKKVFLISLKAGGTGLNLTSADNVIIFDPWWNPSVENQAIDRTHRIGQKKSVNVYRLITKGTIEEKILKLQDKKQFLFDNLVGESKNLFKKLTWEDVKELFK